MDLHVSVELAIEITWALYKTISVLCVAGVFTTLITFAAWYLRERNLEN